MVRAAAPFASSPGKLRERCCAVFPLGATDTYVAIGSFNNFNPHMQNGTTFQNNEFWIGSISGSKKFVPTSRGVLDCKIVILSRFVALSVSLIQKVSLF